MADDAFDAAVEAEARRLVHSYTHSTRGLPTDSGEGDAIALDEDEAKALADDLWFTAVTFALLIAGVATVVLAALQW